MPRELRIGDRVRTPRGNGVVMRSIGREGHPPVGYCVGYADREFWLDHDAASVEPLPADIPRERVADLHAAVTKRLEQLKSQCDMTRPDDMVSTCAAQRWSELSEVAECLRLMLEVPDAE
jgi:hypothetical protein